MEGISLNGLYFLLPFILVASLGIYQDSFAENIIVGETFFDTTNPDGSHTWSTHEPYVLDGNNWVPFINTVNSVQTAGGTVTLNSDGSYSFGTKFTDHIIAKYADISNLNSWTYPNALNNDTPDILWNGTAFISSKIKSGVGQLDYKYVLVNGKWKTQLEATNLSGLTSKAFGFDQIIDLNSDTIKFGGVTRNLDNFNGTVFDKNFLSANSAKIIELLDGINFDFDLGFADLYSITVYDTGVNKSRLVFDYRTSSILLPGKTLIIDPQITYTSTTSTDFVVPSGATSMTVKAWGAGGAGSATSSGGGGGFAQGTMAISYGETYKVIVGGGGVTGGAGGTNGGGASGANGGGGGGYTGVFLTSISFANSKIVAGAGGGGSYITGANGGAGGGSTGGTGSVGGIGVCTNNFAVGGNGGSQVAGGTGGGSGGTKGTDGAALAGGDGGASCATGGGGGAGYYGGGGGGSTGAGSNMGGGGGGSNYVSGSSTTSTQASGATVANSGDPDYLAGKGNGGGPSTNGQDGYIVIDYTLGSPPNPVTVLTASNISTNSLRLDWSAPTSFGSGTFQAYIVNMTTPWGQPLTWKTNSTSLNANVTGLNFGTDYSFRVAAGTSFGSYNTTGSYILNTTTTATTYSVAPVLTKVFPNSYTSTTQLNLEWTAPAMDNILWYKIQRETPIGTGWSTSINTTNANLYYNNTGLSTNVIYNYRIYAANATGLSTASNEKSMTTYHLPDAVTDLVATASDFTTVALSWSVPTSYAPSITGYQVNYTTPQGTPLTIQTPDPYTTTNNAIIYGLTAGEDYSFRVSAVTVHGKNANGNIENVTTSNLFTPGDINPLIAENTADFSIFYTRTDTNTTSSTLTVTYPNTYDLNCNFQYQFDGANDTYTGLTQTVVDTDDVSSSFIFTDPANDVINIRCYDTITGDDAKYVMVINQFPFLDQISNMRNGAYSSYFQVGAIDGVTLMIVILAMIGFNRTNPVAGIMFLVITVGVLSWFEIITYPIIMYPALALLATWAFISTRKDD